VAVLEARARLASVRESELAVQLGGAAGTLASLGADGPAVVAGFAQELGLAEPALPWHTARGRIARLAAALAEAAGATGKVALDVVLLAQTEVAEVAEAAGGGSSTLPHKRNPIAAVRARACAARLPGLASTLLAAMAQEHERAAGAWHSEWEALRDALALTGGAAAWTRESLEGLEVDPERMRANLAASGDSLLAEHVALLAADGGGRLEANAAVRAAGERAAGGGRTLREELLDEPLVRDAIAPEDLDAALDPAGYLGSADVFVERALERHRAEQASR
jgi:3-carboxy-cis,cis-muconate cycloisomerase